MHLVNLLKSTVQSYGPWPNIQRHYVFNFGLWIPLKSSRFSKSPAIMSDVVLLEFQSVGLLSWATSKMFPDASHLLFFMAYVIPSTSVWAGFSDSIIMNRVVQKLWHFWESVTKGLWFLSGVRFLSLILLLRAFVPGKGSCHLVNSPLEKSMYQGTAIAKQETGPEACPQPPEWACKWILSQERYEMMVALVSALTAVTFRPESPS